jgi:hypothetical protein
MIFEILRDKLCAFVAHFEVEHQMCTLSNDVEFLHMWQLHVKRNQFRHSFELSEHCFEPIDNESVAVAIGLLHGASEMKFS